MDTPHTGTSRSDDGGINIQHLLIILFLLSSPLSAQVFLRQTIRGTVYDFQTRTPLAGATIILMDSDPLVGAVTDSNVGAAV